MLFYFDYFVYLLNIFLHNFIVTFSRQSIVQIYLD